MPILTRREFLEAGAASALTLGLLNLSWIAPRSAAAALPPPYSDWSDVYRERWRWDRVVRGTHNHANCVAACAWNLYVRDGIVWLSLIHI